MESENIIESIITGEWEVTDPCLPRLQSQICRVLESAAVKSAPVLSHLVFPSLPRPALSILPPSIILELL